MARRVRVPSKEAEKAKSFAKAYVELVEALQKQGVPEDTARTEARVAALTWLSAEDDKAEYDPAKGPCPTCGNG